MDARELAFAGVVRQAKLIRERQVSARELVSVYLERIERLNPKINAFRTVFAEEALAAAEKVDDGKNWRNDLPLLGVPIAIKDDTEIAQKVASHGSRGMYRPARDDSEVVRLLRLAGAIVIGQTNVPELEIWPFTASLANGVTRNPWDLAYTPGGSSGGSAAAVAAGLVGGATGSDGMGSIRIPASCCGLVGIKPQRGRVSLSPNPEAWHGLAVRGPIARRVADAALLLDVMSGATSRRSLTSSPTAAPFSQAARTAPGRLRVAVARTIPTPIITTVHHEVHSAIDNTVEELCTLGHDVHNQELSYGASLPHAAVRYLRGVHDVAAQVENIGLLEPRTRGFVQLGGRVPKWLLGIVREREWELSIGVGQIFNKYDVVLAPIVSRPSIEANPWKYKGALTTLERASRFAPFAGVWNATGNPAIAVPCGISAAGHPVGVQLVGRMGSEAALVSLASQLESKIGWSDRHPPVS
ncbi:amidase family protein [Streptomyces sp. NBC_01643]|uniref:amidase family protein n=1 Tax=Streptomyces sp. NBC_01643 TaxID=2975906 RepID=UPI002F9172A9|nr:amidase family protein [Streptomyces sp. NBC_01643]